MVISVVMFSFHSHSAQLPTDARFNNIPSATHRQMAAQLETFPQISIDLY